MEYSFQPSNIIKIVKRNARVVIAGIALAIAINASASNPVDQKMSISDPLEQVIAKASADSLIPQIDYNLLNMRAKRLELLNSSLDAHGGKNMNSEAANYWGNLQSDAAEIPFEKVFVQFDDSVGSFFFAYSFVSDHCLEATAYLDDDDVYFSVFSKGEVFFQNAMPKDIFFRNVKSIWSNIINEV